MKKAMTLVASAVFVGAMAMPVAAQHPNACETPEGGPIGNGVYVCTPIGYAEANADGYILADGAESNPDPLDGYIVITADGVGCSDAGDWNPGDPVACNPEPPAVPAP